MTETTNHRAVVFFTVDGSYHVFSDPGVEVLFGHERLSEYVQYKDRPIPEWFLNDAPIHLPPEGDQPDPINQLVLSLA